MSQTNTKTRVVVAAVSTAAAVGTVVWWFAREPQVISPEMLAPPLPDGVVLVPPPEELRFVALGVGPNSVELRWTLAGHASVVVESSSDLSHWSDRGTFTGTNAILPRTGQQAFYRLRAVPPAPATWFRQLAGPAFDYGTTLTVDPSDNIVLAGFSGSAALDLGNGPVSNAPGIFLAKYSPTGTHLWSRRIPGSTGDRATCVALDNAGNIFLGGFFVATANFGGGNVTSAGGMDMFLAKYSPAGEYLWAKTFGSVGHDRLNGVAVDPRNGQVVITGTWPWTNSISFGGDLFHRGSVFLAKFDGANGQHLWSKHFGSVSRCQGLDVAIGAGGEIALAGEFDGGIDFTMNRNDLTFAYTSNTIFGVPDTLGAPSQDAFLARFTADGAFQWARTWGSPYTDTATDVGLGPAGELYVTGHFWGQTTLGGSNLVARHSADIDVYVAKFSVTGAHVWSVSLPGDRNEKTSGLAVDNAGDVWVSGDFGGVIVAGGYSLTSAGGLGEGFMARFNPGGVAIGAWRFGGNDREETYDLGVTGTRQPVLTGLFQGGTMFDGVWYPSAGSVDGFLVRL